MSHSGFSHSNERPGSDHAARAADAGLVPPAPDGALPLLDLTAIQTLEDQLDNPLTARNFARDFIEEPHPARHRIDVRILAVLRTENRSEKE